MLAMDDMHTMVELSAHRIEKGGHREMLCTEAQFSQWSKALRGAKEFVKPRIAN